MRIVLLAIIGLFSYLIIAIPGYFFLVPRNDVIDESLETVTEQMFDCLLYTSPSPRDLST